MKPGPNNPSGYGKPPKGPPLDESTDDKTWAMLAHLSCLVFSIFGPLIIMLVKTESPFVQHHAKEALNFQLAVLIVALVSIVTCVGPFIVTIGGLVYGIIATVETNKGQYYDYPYTIRLIK